MKKLKITIAGTTGTGKTITAVYLEKVLKDAGFSVKLLPNRDMDQDQKKRRLADPFTMEAYKLIFPEIEVEIEEIQLPRMEAL